MSTLPNNSFTHYDERAGDTYDIFTDFEGDFEQALRYIDRVGADPISYDAIGELPPSVRNAIEQKIMVRKRRTNQKL